jgi:outer membrane protein assembly factor BamB
LLYIVSRRNYILKKKIIKSCFSFGLLILVIPSGISSDDYVDLNILDTENDIIRFLPIFSAKNCTPEFKYDEYISKNYFVYTENKSNFLKKSIDSDIFKSSIGPINFPWPMKCHDLHHTGRSPYSTAENPYDVVWRFKTDGWMETSPIIGNNGTLYFGGNFGDLPWYIIAVNPDGSEKWRYKTGGLIMGSSPAIAEDGTVYIGSWDSKLYAFYPNGTLKWKTGTGGSISSSPAIAMDGTIYIGTLDGFDHGGYIVAINSNGTREWKYETNNEITGDPAIADDGTIYIGSQDDYLYAMNPNGTLKWRYKTGHHIRGPPSIADDGTIYVGSVDKHLHAVNPDGTIKWKHFVGDEIATNPSIAEDGTIYGCGNKIWAINPNGTRKWTFDMGNDVRVDASSPAICADGIIYFGTNIGETSGGHIIALNPDGTERWRKKIANLWVESSPSIGKDGTVYIGSSSEQASGDSYGYLYAFNRANLRANTDGPHYGLIDIPIDFTGDGYGGYKPYSYLWDFGDGTTSDEQNPTHTYTSPDNYTVTLTVTDNTSNTSWDSTFAWIQDGNDAPDTPTVDGPVDGSMDTKYDYTFQSSDPEGLHIWYFIDWGDGKDTGWIGPYNSDEEFIKGHRWTEQGSYIIKCKAKDPYDGESDWGELEVTIPRTRASSYHWLLKHFPILERLLSLLL